jgi:protein-disulfide isomerase
MEVIDGTVNTLEIDPWRSMRQRLSEMATDSPSKGSRSAPVLLVEFSDLQCPFCSQFSQEIDELESEMPDTLRVVFKHFPLGAIHPWASSAAKAGVCIA